MLDFILYLLGATIIFIVLYFVIKKAVFAAIKKAYEEKLLSPSSPVVLSSFVSSGSGYCRGCGDYGPLNSNHFCKTCSNSKPSKSSTGYCFKCGNFEKLDSAGLCSNCSNQ